MSTLSSNDPPSRQDRVDAERAGNPNRALSEIDETIRSSQRSGRSIVELLLESPTSNGEDAFPIRISDVRVEGTLDLRGATVTRDFEFSDCTFVGPIRLDEAKLASIRFNKCIFGEDLSMTQCIVKGDLAIIGGSFREPSLENSRVDLTGIKTLSGVVIAPETCHSELRFTDASFGDNVKISGEYSRKIRADRAQFGQSLHLKSMTCLSDVTLRNATINSVLALDEVMIKGLLDLHRLATEVITISNVHIDERLGLSNGTIKQFVLIEDLSVNPEGVSAHFDSIDMERIAVANDMVFTGKSLLKGSLNMNEARIGGSLKLRGLSLTASIIRPALAGRKATVAGSFEFLESTLVGQVDLSGVDIGRNMRLAMAVTIDSPHLLIRSEDSVGVLMEGGTVHGDLRLGSDGFDLRPFISDGLVSFAKATVNGNLAIGSAQFATKKKYSLDLSRIEIGGNLICDEGRNSMSGVRLVDAQVKGDAVFGGTILAETTGFVMDGIRVYNTLTFTNTFNCSGTLRAVNAIVENLELEGRYNGMGAEAIIFDGVQVGNLISMSIATTGQVRIVGAKCASAAISGEIRSSEDSALLLDGAEFTKSLVLERLTGGGRLSLVRTHTGTLDVCGLTNVPVATGSSARFQQQDGSRDDQGRSSEGNKQPDDEWLVDLRDSNSKILILPPSDVAPACQLSNAQFEAIEPNPPPSEVSQGVVAKTNGDADPIPASDRLSWLKRDPDGYSPDPYRILAAAYRRRGYTRSAVEVSIMSEKLRRAGASRWWQRIWSWLQFTIVRYGYQPWYAIPWLIGFWLLGSVLIWIFRSDFQTPKDGAVLPDFNPFVYFLDQLLPFLATKQDLYVAFGVSVWLVPALVLIGWVLFTAAAAGVASAVKREG